MQYCSIGKSAIPTFKNQIDLLWKSVDWFLFDGNFGA